MHKPVSRRISKRVIGEETCICETAAFLKQQFRCLCMSIVDRQFKTRGTPGISSLDIGPFVE